MCRVWEYKHASCCLSRRHTRVYFMYICTYATSSRQVCRVWEYLQRHIVCLADIHACRSYIYMYICDLKSPGVEGARICAASCCVSCRHTRVYVIYMYTVVYVHIIYMYIHYRESPSSRQTSWFSLISWTLNPQPLTLNTLPVWVLGDLKVAVGEKDNVLICIRGLGRSENFFVAPPLVCLCMCVWVYVCVCVCVFLLAW